MSRIRGMSAVGSDLRFAGDRLEYCASRHAVPARGSSWVGRRLRRRLRCGARAEVAPPNSLRGLRPLRSTNVGESEVDAHCARRPRRCAPRRPTNRPERVPPAALQRSGGLSTQPARCGRQGCGRACPGANGRRREAQPREGCPPPKGGGTARTFELRAQARRASGVTAVRGRVPQPPSRGEHRRGSRPAGPGRRRLSARACSPAALHARSHEGAQSGRRTPATGRKQPSTRHRPAQSGGAD